LSSAKLICAAYQVAQKEGTQTVTVNFLKIIFLKFSQFFKGFSSRMSNAENCRINSTIKCCLCCCTRFFG